MKNFQRIALSHRLQSVATTLALCLSLLLRGGERVVEEKVYNLLTSPKRSAPLSPGNYDKLTNGLISIGDLLCDPRITEEDATPGI